MYSSCTQWNLWLSLIKLFLFQVWENNSLRYSMLVRRSCLLALLACSFGKSPLDGVSATNETRPELDNLGDNSVLDSSYSPVSIKFDLSNKNSVKLYYKHLNRFMSFSSKLWTLLSFFLCTLAEQINSYTLYKILFSYFFMFYIC